MRQSHGDSGEGERDDGFTMTEPWYHWRGREGRRFHYDRAMVTMGREGRTLYYDRAIVTVE